jgi:hypothetical protein
MSSSSSSSQQQTFAQRLAAMYQSALVAVLERYEEMVLKVRSCDTTTSTPDDWKQRELELQFCADVRDQGIRHAQKLYGILGAGRQLATDGRCLMVCGNNDEHALDCRSARPNTKIEVVAEQS